MKRTKKELLTLKFMCDFMSNERCAKAISDSNKNDSTNGFYDFDFTIEQFDCGLHVELTSYKCTTEARYFQGLGFKYAKSYVSCSHSPTVIQMFCDRADNEDFNSVVAFVRSAYKNGIENMKFGRVKVESEVIDHLDFDLI